MNIRREIILFCLLSSSVVAVFSYNFFLHNSPRTSVKGAQTSVSPTPTFTPSPTNLPILTPTPTNKPISVKAQVTPQAKQDGGWYWRSELGRTQRWLGTDSQEKDIWSDTGDPTPTPTQSNPSSTNTSKKFDELQFGTSTHDATPTQQPSPSSSGASASGTSSSGVSSSVTSMTDVQKQICSKDGSNPNVPKCP